MGGVLDQFQTRIREGRLAPDAAQAQAAAQLDALAIALEAWRPGGLFAKPPPRGLYIWGAVGRGKSMLMDLFFDAVAIAPKQRVHFHAFMRDQHTFMKQARASGGANQDQLIVEAAKHVASQARLLCFDEFAVSDIADAMILGRLFEQLLTRKVVVVATSNRAPGDLYKNGLNRQLFLPFIGLLEHEMDVIELAAARDYRLERLMAAPVYYWPLGPHAAESLLAAWARLTMGASGQPAQLQVAGRTIPIARAAAGCAWMTFDELCARPLGAGDYLELAERFHTLILEGVPKLPPAMREEAARFRLLIDALYEAKTKLICSAEAEPQGLYPEGDMAFEFERTVSRLMEMRSETYLALPARDAAFKRAIVE
jgi:cell division protein ZapE